ncbi:MAG: hypothetical protein Rsou_0563 [Candidatus Ruthia sp. Asou_11_S2]|nr:hypothetical protein [Candidatus Ruthia sp. Asou_11_S2]
MPNSLHFLNSFIDKAFLIFVCFGFSIDKINNLDNKHL